MNVTEAGHQASSSSLRRPATLAAVGLAGVGTVFLGRAALVDAQLDAVLAGFGLLAGALLVRLLTD
mgnify:CR=1 FL=1